MFFTLLPNLKVYLTLSRPQPTNRMESLVNRGNGRNPNYNPTHRLPFHSTGRPPCIFCVFFYVCNLILIMFYFASIQFYLISARFYLKSNQNMMFLFLVEFGILFNFRLTNFLVRFNLI